MSDTAVYVIWAVILLAANFSAWLANLFSLPGNWIVAALAALFAWFYPAAPGDPGIHWGTIVAVVILAVIGEIIEFVAGAAGAAKLGASRRSILLAIVGAFVGSLVGASALAVVPVLGPIVGAVGGGALGAFAGTFIGETWVGKHPNHSYAASRAALFGRLFGTLGKFLVGAVMVAVVTLDSFIGW